MLQRSICVVLNRSALYGSRARALVTKHCTWKYIYETSLSISQYTSKYVWSIDKPDITGQKFKHFYCGELRASSIGRYVELEGTIYRDDGYLVLEDKTGTVHLVVNDKNKHVLAVIKQLKMNSYLKIIGLVIENPFSKEKGTIAVVIENVISKSSFKNDSGKESHAVMKPETSILTLHPLEQSKCTSGDVLKFFFQRTHSCNIMPEIVGMNVILCGWIAAEPNGKCFVLQDGYGLVPVVYDRQDGNLIQDVNNLKNEKIVSVKGIVTSRPDYACTDNPIFQNNVEISLTSLKVIDDTYNKENNILENYEAEELNNSSKTWESLKSSDVLLPEMNGNVIPDVNKYTIRSHTCGELNENHIGQKVKLMGWVEFQRLDRFILLRDKYGLIQLSLDPSDKILRSKLLSLSIESVISVEGVVCARPEGQENKRMKTGAIEVLVAKLEIINQSETLPFTSKSKAISKHVQLMYRYLDLRLNPTVMNNLKLRCDVIHKMRKYLIENLGFLEVETPTLFKKTPGGAQEFIVPTRNKREFYSLVQSPQQFKQLLMVGSVDKYFQIARCYRDETSRKDRQPEFTQLDMEMSFCNREGIINLIEDVLKFAWPKNLGSISTPFPRITYEVAMKTYGSDKPDTRIDLKITDLTKIFNNEKGEWSEAINFQSMRHLEDFAAHCIVVPGGKTSQVKLKKLAKEKSIENKFTIYTFMPKTKYGFESSLKPIFTPSIALDIAESVDCDAGDVVFLGLGPKNTILKTFGEMRLNVAEILNENQENVSDKSFNFLWVVDFPLFEVNEEGLIQSVHHPFTQVHPDDTQLLKTDPLKARSLHFDLVANGKELGGGSVRIHDAETQKEILENILNVDVSTLNHLLKALAMGAPTHGGFALGIDRLIALLCNASSLTDVIAFPKFHSGRDPLSGAPSDIPKSDKILYNIYMDNDEKDTSFTVDEDVQEMNKHPESQ